MPALALLSGTGPMWFVAVVLVLSSSMPWNLPALMTVYVKSTVCNGDDLLIRTTLVVDSAPKAVYLAILLGFHTSTILLASRLAV
ncbi:hypothetical protein K435DRAFT_863092 [Dendrothele bispora CBS 962.96]|uniref:Uncharacterized protein n=1 Tax=Dendrothele bispora (strain CBS 962.96) TaxID=1314807 RepID=A0A4S8LQW0_DENBC|nr:hypothetical protein K435DRAFT_863092 [Dendrothele bispora CBS 962.96]